MAETLQWSVRLVRTFRTAEQFNRVRAVMRMFSRLTARQKRHEHEQFYEAWIDVGGEG